RGVVTVVYRGGGGTRGALWEAVGRTHGDETLLDRLEAADRHVELLADARVGAGDVGGEGGAGGGERGKRDAAPGGEGGHQHLPALAGLRGAADDVVERDEHVAPARRAVLEHHHRRQVAAADLDAGQVRRHQRHGDADVLAFAEQVIGIVELEGEPDHGGDGPERDVALVPVEPDAERLAALPGAAAHHAGIDHRGGVRARFRAGEREAGNLLGRGEP